MTTIVSITFFNIKNTLFKIQHLVSNNKHKIIIYKMYFFIYFKIKELDVSSQLEANKKINEIAEKLYYLENLFRENNG